MNALKKMWDRRLLRQIRDKRRDSLGQIKRMADNNLTNLRMWQSTGKSWNPHNNTQQNKKSWLYNFYIRSYIYDYYYYHYIGSLGIYILKKLIIKVLDCWIMLPL